MKRNSWIMTLSVTLLVVVGMFLASGDLSYYGDVASAVLVVFLPLVVLFAAYTPQQIVSHFGACREKETDEASAREALVFFENYRRTVLFSLLIPLFIGTTAILRWQWTDDPERLSHIGKGLGTIMLSAIYGTATLGLIILPRLSALKKKLTQ